MHSGYTVGWGALALINAALAQDRNRSALAWFVGSLLLGPIATLLLISWGPAEPANESVQWSARDQWINIALGAAVVVGGVAALVLVSVVANR